MRGCRCHGAGRRAQHAPHRYGTVLYGNPDDAQRAIGKTYPRRPRKSLKFLIFVELFNGYSWQSRILEVRADRLPPDFDAPLGPNGYPVAVPSPLHAMPYMALPQQQLQQGTLPLAGGEDVQQIPSPMGMYFAGLQQDRNRLPSANGRTLFVGNVRVLSLTSGIRPVSPMDPRVQGARVVR